jgi:hypothetical protein
MSTPWFPGPYRAHGDDYVEAGDNCLIARVLVLDPRQRRATQRLLAASEKMLSALEGLEPYLDHIPGGIGAEIDDAREAIRSAKGDE